MKSENPEWGCVPFITLKLNSSTLPPTHNTLPCQLLREEMQHLCNPHCFPKEQTPWVKRALDILTCVGPGPGSEGPRLVANSAEFKARRAGGVESAGKSRGCRLSGRPANGSSRGSVVAASLSPSHVASGRASRDARSPLGCCSKSKLGSTRGSRFCPSGSPCKFRGGSGVSGPRASENGKEPSGRSPGGKVFPN